MDESIQAQLPDEANKILTAEKPDQAKLVPRSSPDASYEVCYADEGVFLEITRERENGEPLRQELVLFDLCRRGIEGLNVDILRFSLRRKDIRVRLAGPQKQKQADSDVAVTVSSNGMTAGMMLFPPVDAGGEKTAEEVLERIRTECEITFGLNEQLVRDIVENKVYNKYIEIAHGKPAERGKDGEIVFAFSAKRSYAPEILPDGSADYKSLKLFERVSEGEVVATALPPEDGIDGMTDKGEIIPAQRGKEKKLPKGKNVKESEDGKSLIAEKSGRVDFIKDRVEVSNVYHVTGDVDMGVGNIVFDGDVMIDGSIIAGLSVQATGSIEVRGSVEGATLVAGKDIVLRNGMQGMNQGKLEADGNVVARFIERASITAHGSVFADYIAHCLIVANGSVVLKGKWGRLLGGLIRAGKEVTANTIGSPGNDQTQIELGTLPDERARYTKLDAERGQIKAQLNRIQNITRMSSSSDTASDRLAMRQKLIETGQQLEEQYENIVLQMEALKEALSSKSEARVNAIKAIYPNVKIQIDSGILTTKSMIDYATFRCVNGQIVFTSCEVRG